MRWELMLSHTQCDLSETEWVDIMQQTAPDRCRSAAAQVAAIYAQTVSNILERTSGFHAELLSQDGLAYMVTTSACLPYSNWSEMWACQ